MKNLIKQLDDLFDMWLMIEHNEAWKIIKENRERKEQDNFFNPEILSADDMKGMLEQVKSLVGVVD